MLGCVQPAACRLDPRKDLNKSLGSEPKCARSRQNPLENKILIPLLKLALPEPTGLATLWVMGGSVSLLTPGVGHRGDELQETNHLSVLKSCSPRLCVTVAWSLMSWALGVRTHRVGAGGSVHQSGHRGSQRRRSWAGMRGRAWKSAGHRLHRVGVWCTRTHPSASQASSAGAFRPQHPAPSLDTTGSVTRGEAAGFTLPGKPEPVALPLSGEESPAPQWLFSMFSKMLTVK